MRDGRSSNILSISFYQITVIHFQINSSKFAIEIKQQLDWLLIFDRCSHSMEFHRGFLVLMCLANFLNVSNLGEGEGEECGRSPIGRKSMSNENGKQKMTMAVDTSIDRFIQVSNRLMFLISDRAVSPDVSLLTSLNQTDEMFNK